MGIVPDKLKIARVIPMYKSDDDNIFSNHRPASVLPAFSKVLEKIPYNRLISFLDKFNNVPSYIVYIVFGRNIPLNTHNSLIHLSDKISSAIDNTEGVYSWIFIDLSKKPLTL